MIKSSKIETSAGLTELSGTELDVVAGGAFRLPLPPTGGGTNPPGPRQHKRLMDEMVAL
jgi:hypothetical protein